MKLEDDIRPITYLKANAAEALDTINETGRPMIITQSGKTRAVLQDPASYEKMVTALSNLKLLSMGEKDVQKGRLKSQDDLFSDLQSKIDSQ